MGQPFASAKNAVGICDRCGFQYKLQELKSEVVDLHVTGLLVCYECWDPDQPQLQLGRWPVNDPQAIRNPRPPQGLEQSRYSGAIRYDFTDSAEDFTLTRNTGGGDVSYGSVTHDFSAGTIVSKPNDTADGRTLNGIVSPTVSVRTADLVDGVRVPSYVYVRVRVRIFGSVDGSTPLPVPSPNTSYDGKMYWRTSSGAYSLSASSVSSPDWNQMGEPYQVLTWDMSDNEDWLGSSGTVVTGLYWIFFTGLTKSGEYEIDYVRFEKE